MRAASRQAGATFSTDWVRRSARGRRTSQSVKQGMLEIAKRLHSLPACRHFALHQSVRPRLSFLKNFPMRAFGRPKGLVGRLGGIVMAWSNRRIATRTVELLNIEPSDRVLEIGFGPGAGI